MNTTINRRGQITQLSFIKNKETKQHKQAAVINFRGGYIKLYFTDEDIPNGLMLKDEVEISLSIENND